MRCIDTSARTHPLRLHVITETTLAAWSASWLSCNDARLDD
jgi:hypothetical protein